MQLDDLSQAHFPFLSIDKSIIPSFAEVAKHFFEHTFALFLRHLDERTSNTPFFQGYRQTKNRSNCQPATAVLPLVYYYNHRSNGFQPLVEGLHDKVSFIT